WGGGQPMIGQATAFTLFAAIGWSCLVLAVVQDGVALAVMGIVGAFLAPLLASTGSGDHRVLFSYYAVLNVFIVVVNLAKGWRQLNAWGFVFTFIVGFMWGRTAYRPEFFFSAELFLLLFFLMYSITPVVYSLVREPMLKHPSDALMVFGTPAVAFLLQEPLVRGQEYGLAVSALAGGVYYFVLCAVLRGRSHPGMALMEQAHAL